MSIGDNVKKLRLGKGLSQTQLAEKLMVSSQTVSRWERGSMPEFSMLASICAVLEVSIETLLGEESSEDIIFGCFELDKMGNLIAEKRREMNLTQIELAEKVLTNGDTVSKWERGVTCPDIDKFILIAKELNLGLSELYYGVNKPMSKDEKRNEVKEEITSKKGYNKLIIAFSVVAVLVMVSLFSVVILGFQLKAEKDRIGQLESLNQPNNKIDFSKEWIIPVNYTHVIRESGLAYYQSISRYMMHNGVDFTAPEGSCVYSVNGGEVVEICKDGDDGNYIKIRHENNVYSLYRYVNPIDSLKEGQTVKKGEQIATVSISLGLEYKDEDHLHFELFENEESVEIDKYIVFD